MELNRQKSEVEHIIKTFIIHDETELVEFLLENGYFVPFTIENYYDADGNPRYINQWYRIDKTLYDDLDELGYPVLSNYQTDYFWGTTTGDHLTEKSALYEVAKKHLGMN